LEIGSGAGALHMNLVKLGAKKSVGVDASEWAVKASEQLKKEIDPSINSETITAQISQTKERFGEFSVVIMDRVLCCYPHPETLLETAVLHSPELITLSIPRNLIWIRIGAIMVNIMQSILRRKFRIFVHSHDRIEQILRNNQFVQIHSDETRLWKIRVYRSTGFK
jgi:magnesium-protoporphyrin O-methyltransferase